MDLVDLVELVGAREERMKRDQLEHDTAGAPHVHRVSIVAVGEETLGRTVPPRRDVFRVRLLGVDTPHRPKVSQLQQVTLFFVSLIIDLNFFTKNQSSFFSASLLLLKCFPVSRHDENIHTFKTHWKKFNYQNMSNVLGVSFLIYSTYACARWP